jgi:hypothetical protein
MPKCKPKLLYGCTIDGNVVLALALLGVYCCVGFVTLGSKFCPFTKYSVSSALLTFKVKEV